MEPGIRHRARDAVRTEIAAEVCEIFAEHGFDTLTVDEVARRAGMSRATFFRYFGSKEEAVISATQSGADPASVLAGLDSRTGESVWQLIRRAFEPAVRAAESNPERLRARIRMISSTPSLRASLSARHAEGAGRFGAELSRRLGDPLDGRLYAATGFAAMDTAWRTWSEQPDASFRAIVDDLFDRVLRVGSTPGV